MLLLSSSRKTGIPLLSTLFIREIAKATTHQLQMAGPVFTSAPSGSSRKAGVSTALPSI